jgi:hypothetical protein
MYMYNITKLEMDESWAWNETVNILFEDQKLCKQLFSL